MIKEVLNPTPPIKERDPRWLAWERQCQVDRIVGPFIVDAWQVDQLKLRGLPQWLAPKTTDYDHSMVEVSELEGLNLHEVLGVSKEEYIASVPPIPPQPEQWHGRFDLPVLVDPRISLIQLAEQLKFTPIDITGWKERYHSGIVIPDKPYWIWAHDATDSRNADILAEDWWKGVCADDERGLTMMELSYWQYLQPDAACRSPWFFAAPASIIDVETFGLDLGELVPYLGGQRIQKIGGSAINGYGMSFMTTSSKSEMICMTSCGDWQKIKKAA